MHILSVWLLLIFATLVAWGFGHGGKSEFLSLGVIVITFSKVSIIASDFMELRRAPYFARILFILWASVTSLTIVVFIH